MLCYHPYFWYTMDSSNKDIIFDCNPLSKSYTGTAVFFDCVSCLQKSKLNLYLCWFCFVTTLKQLLLLFVFEEGQTSTRPFCFYLKNQQKKKKPKTTAIFSSSHSLAFFALLVTYPFLKPHPEIFPPSCF